MKIIVTGAAGFIGSHLTERLLDESHFIIGIDNFDDFYNPQIKRLNISSSLKNENFKLFEADIRDSEACDKIITDDVYAIVHLAAKAGVRPSIEQPALYTDVNISGTLVLLEAAKKRNVKKFIFASSSSIYGNNKKIPFSEDDPVDHPISPYAATKKACELICHTYHHLYGIDVTSLRYFTVYGPRQRPDLAIHKFAAFIEKEKPIPIYGDGSMMRDFTYIDDIIDGTVSAIEQCDGYHLYNLGESRTISVNDLVTELEKALGKKAKKELLPPQPGDVEKTCADVTRAINELGYNPSTDLQTGLKKFVTWLRDQA